MYRSSLYGERLNQKKKHPDSSWLDSTTYGAAKHHRNHHKEKENPDQHIVDDLLGRQTTGCYKCGLPNWVHFIPMHHQTFRYSRHHCRSRWRCAGIICSCDTENTVCFPRWRFYCLWLTRRRRAHLVQYLLSFRIHPVSDGSQFGITTEGFMNWVST